jgi:hypothetical protein
MEEQLARQKLELMKDIEVNILENSNSPLSGKEKLD